MERARSGGLLVGPRKLTEVEVLVVGGGPAGSALALELQRRGREVLLVDAGASRRKICGEGILPLGWAVLESLGVSRHLTRYAPIDELRYQMPSSDGRRIHQLRATLSLPSRGVARESLSQALEESLTESGVSVWRGTRFRAMTLEPNGVRVRLEGESQGEVHCRLLVGADGLRSRVREQAGLTSLQPRRFSRWGARMYFRDETVRNAVTVTLGEGVETYLTPLGDGLNGLAFLWSPELLGRPPAGQGAVWQRLLASFPPCYREQLPPSEAFFGPEKAIGPLQQLVTSPLHPSGRVALVGDASGYLDALTGEGLCLGLVQAMALAELYVGGRVEQYPARYRALKRRHSLTVHGLLRLLERPRLKRFVFSTLCRFPPLFQLLISGAVEGSARAEIRSLRQHL